MKNSKEKDDNVKHEAPVFYPTEEEFENPFEFIESIRTEAELYGICRIIPPKSWKPTFSLDLSQFQFPTRVQSIHQLYKRDAAEQSKDDWWGRYIAFQLEQNKRQRTRNPTLGGKELELCRLYAAVEERGGYNEVCQNKLWKDIARTLQVHLSNGNTTYSLRMVYEKYLKDFEEKEMKRSTVKKEPLGNKESSVIVDQEEEESPQTKKIKSEVGDAVATSCSSLEFYNGKNRRRRKDGKVPGNLEVLMCEHCGGGQFEDCIILCDNCPTDKTKGYHTFCCSPPYDKIPDGNFYCPDCSAKLFARQCFTTGPNTTYDEFKEYAAEYEKSFRVREEDEKEIIPEELESEFWHIIESGEENIEVLYGADIPTGSYGSGFPTDGRDHYSSHPMNLNNLAKDQSSLLRLIPDDIPGVVVPWLYMGMKFSTFCWHVEDHLFYSINYLHKGAMKKWYGISSNQGQQFESLLQKNLLKDQFSEQPDLLFHITTMVSPQKLRQNGIHICETLQHEGEFVITFPMAYHGGFNMGLNIAEAVNFAPIQWLEFRKRAAMRYINHRKPQVMSTEELVLKAAMDIEQRFHGKILFQEVEKILQEENFNRLVLWNEGIVKSLKLTFNHGLRAGDKEDACCVICRDFLHVSAVVCSCCHRPCCLKHVHQQCECALSTRTLLYRFSLSELADIQSKVQPNQDQANAGSNQEKMKVEKVDVGLKRERDSNCKESIGWNRFRAFQEDWRRRAEAVLSSTDLNMPAMERLVSESMQFLWAGHEVDDLRQLCLKINESLEWYSDLKESLRNENQKFTLEELQQMINRPSAHSNHPVLLKLKKIEKSVEDWIMKTSEMMHPAEDIKFSDLSEFSRRGSEMNVVLPDLEKVKEKVHEVQALQRTIESVFRDPSSDFPTPLLTLEELKALQSKAQEMRIHFEERNQLDEFLAMIEDWVLRAQKTEGEKILFSVLSQLLNEVGSASADIHELLCLKNRLKRAEDWVKEARLALMNCQSVEEMKELLLRGKELDVAIDEMCVYESKLKQLEWQELVQASSQMLITVEELDQFLDRGNYCEAEGLELFQELKNKRQRVGDLEKKGKDLLSKVKEFQTGEQKIPYDELKSLIEDSESVKVFIPVLKDCQELNQQVYPLYESMDRTMSLMESSQALKSWELRPIVDKAENLPFSFPHLSELRRRVKLAEDFSSKASKLLTGGLKLSDLSDLQEVLKQGDEFVKVNGFKIVEMEMLLEWDTRLRIEWLMHFLLCEADTTANSGSSVHGSPLDTVEFSPLIPLRSYFSTEMHKKPRLEAVAAVLDLAKRVSANFQLLSRLERAYGASKEWTEYTRKTLQGHKKLKLLEIINLLQLGKDNAFRLDGVEELDSIMMSYASWTKNVDKMLCVLENTRLPLDEVQKYLLEINRLPIDPEPELLNKLKVVVSPGLELKDSFEKLFRYRSLEDILLTVEKVNAASQLSPVLESGCYCGQKSEQDNVVYCAKCSHWYHHECIPFLNKSSRRWLCSACKEETNKPTASILRSHLNRCQMLKVSLSEEKALEMVINGFTQWSTRVLGKLELHEQSLMKNGDVEKSLKASELSSIWKQALVIGIDSKEISERAWKAIKVEGYRSTIKTHLQEGGPTRFVIERCRKEEIPLHIVAKKPQSEIVKSFVENSAKPEDPSLEDPLVMLAKRALASVHVWETECQHLSLLLNGHAGEPIEQVPSDLLRKTHEHIDKATTMKIQVNRDALEHLIFQSTAYCICRQTNDMDRPMLACEEEDDCPILWFHHRCVGLNENEMPPPGYKCPHCTFRRGEMYPYKLPRGSEIELARQYGTGGDGGNTTTNPDTDGVGIDTTNNSNSSFMLPGEAGDQPIVSRSGGGSGVYGQLTNGGLDIAKFLYEVSTQWDQWSDIERLRVLEHLGECVREESRRIHEMQQKNNK